MITQVTCLLLCAVLVGAGREETTLIPPPFSHDLGFHRASKFYLDMYLGRNFQYKQPEGLACEKLRAEDDTTTSQDDHILSVFAVNSGSGQILCNIGMRRLTLYGRKGSGEGEFANPHGIAVNRAGDVLVADTDNDRVVRLRYSRAGLEFIRAFTGLGHPRGVALDSRARIYVTDFDHSEVKVLDSTGAVLLSWGGLDRPTAIAVMDAQARYNALRESLVVVIDRNGQRLTKFSLQGERLASVEAREIGLIAAEFAHCALDYYASVYVTDRLNDQVHKFDHDLSYLASFGRSGHREGEFNSPRGIAIGRQFGQVFIAEAEGGQYYWIGLDAYFVGCFPEEMGRDQPGTTIALYTTEASELALDIYDQKNKLVRELYSGRGRQKAGELLLVWDGRDEAGTPVPPGEYTVKAVLKMTYGGTRRYFRKELTGKVKRI